MNIVKKLILYTGIGIFGLPEYGDAQNYQIFPDDTLNCAAPYNDLLHFNIQQNNLTDSFLIFSWEKVHADLPAGWMAFLCDNGFCYDYFPEEGIMDTVYPGDYGLMSVGVNPYDIPGSGQVQYIVRESSTPEQTDTLTWIVSSFAPSGISGTGENNFSIFPNPASENIYFTCSRNEPVIAELITLNGKIIYSASGNSDTLIIPVNDFTAGMYIIRIHFGAHILNRSIFIQH